MKLFDATGMLTQKMMTAFGNTGERAVSTHGHGHQWFRSGTVRLRRSGSPHWTASGGITTYSVYDGAQVIADVTAGGALLRSYTWGPGIDNLLALTVHTGTTARTYYAIKDHLGSVHALVDAAGSIVEQYRFDAWGRTTVYDGVGQPLAQSALGNRYVWQGREFSWATGFYLFRARWYDPVVGRFISRDPIGITGGLNEYAFCNNNPANFRDPSGLLYDWLSDIGLSGANRGGILGEIQMDLAAAGVGVLDAIGGRIVEGAFSRSGAASGKGCTGKAWAWGISGALYGVFDAFTLGRLGQGLVPLSAELRNFSMYELGAHVYPTTVFRTVQTMSNAERGTALVASYGSVAAVKALSASTPNLTRAAVYLSTTPTPAAYYFAGLPAMIGANGAGGPWLDSNFPR